MILNFAGFEINYYYYSLQVNRIGTRPFDMYVTMASTPGRWSGGRSPLHWLETWMQARRQRGGRGGNAPPDFFLAPHGIFLGGRSWCFSAEKTLKLAISARKRLGFRRRPFFFFWRSPVFGRKICDFGQKKPSDFDLFYFLFFFGDHLFLGGKFVISARKSLRISAKTFAPLI